MLTLANDALNMPLTDEIIGFPHVIIPDRDVESFLG